MPRPVPVLGTQKEGTQDIERIATALVRPRASLRKDLPRALLHGEPLVGTHGL